MIEILAPAGEEQCAKVALLSGANAIYLGLSEFSAREGAENFALENLRKTADFAHLLGAKVYVCLNTLVKDGETERFFETARLAYEAGADAILTQDIFLGAEIKKRYPQIEMHLSTQAGTCNEYGAFLAKGLDYSRVVLARETPIEEIKKISKIIETEVFVQGALCTCFSGQCYLSSFAGNNSGNRGRCKQPCRKRYRIDREGYEKDAYALSPSDLSVGERIFELIEAGVTSLKIEGRMRRAEYVASAVQYYRAILQKREAKKQLSRLKRAFNRGDYTRGLAFGQAGDFLSRKVQGHIGEYVGEIIPKGKGYFCKGKANKGDGFKILRAGEEVGGAVCTAVEKDGFWLSSSQKLRLGDEVRVTSDTQNMPERTCLKQITLSLSFMAGDYPRVKCGEYEFIGSEILQTAKNAPLSKEELISCFQKTDTLPFAVTVEAQTDNVFMPKSALNALRRAFYEGYVRWLLPQREPLPSYDELRISHKKESKTALIVRSFKGKKADILILKPQNYANISPELLQEGEGEKYLYLPSYFTSADEQTVREVLPYFDGIYCEGYYGIALARKYEKPLFAGTGFHITNRYSYKGLKEAGAKYIALSKELSGEEQKALANEGVFALGNGGVKVMDLCYCPFERTCATCDEREFYTLTDEEGREFPLRRVRFAEKPCRFELYNCARLTAQTERVGLLSDLTVERFNGETKGHFNRSML